MYQNNIYLSILNIVSFYSAPLWYKVYKSLFIFHGGRILLCMDLRRDEWTQKTSMRIIGEKKGQCIVRSISIFFSFSMFFNKSFILEAIWSMRSELYASYAEWINKCLLLKIIDFQLTIQIFMYATDLSIQSRIHKIYYDLIIRYYRYVLNNWIIYNLFVKKLYKKNETSLKEFEIEMNKESIHSETFNQFFKSAAFLKYDSVAR